MLSPPDEVVKMRETYYAAPAVRKYEADLKKGVAAAQQARVSGRISQQEYATQIKLLEEERDQKIEVAKEAARQLTVVPVKSQGKDFRRAVEAFGNGNVDDALQIMKSPSFGKIAANTSAVPTAPWVFRSQMEELGGDRQAAEASLRKAAALAWFKRHPRQGCSGSGRSTSAKQSGSPRCSSAGHAMSARKQRDWRLEWRLGVDLVRPPPRRPAVQCRPDRMAAVAIDGELEVPAITGGPGHNWPRPSEMPQSIFRPQKTA